jgi:hypothetical protein
VKRLFIVWIPIAFCFIGIALILAGIVVLYLVTQKHLGKDAVTTATRLLGFGASLILSAATSAALHAAWTMVRGVEK